MNLAMPDYTAPTGISFTLRVNLLPWSVRIQAYFIRSQNVLMNRLDLSNAAYLPAAVYASMCRTSVHEGDVLLNITGASIGRVTWVRGLDREANVNQHVCIVRLDSKLAAPEYVSVCLSLPPQQRMINTIQTGASRQGLNHQQVRSLQIPLPPVPLQREFAARVGGGAGVGAASGRKPAPTGRVVRRAAGSRLQRRVVAPGPSSLRSSQSFHAVLRL